MYEVYKLHFYSRDLVQISLRQLIPVEVTIHNCQRGWLLYLDMSGNSTIIGRMDTVCRTTRPSKWHYCKQLEESYSIATIGPWTYKTLRNVVMPRKPEEMSYQDLLAAMKTHYRSTPSEIVQRFRFNSRSSRTWNKRSKYTCGNAYYYLRST